MNTNNIYFVILLVIGVVVLSNLAMFAMVRASRNMNFDWLKNMRGTINHSFKAEKDDLGKLRQQVSALEDDVSDSPEIGESE